jgi:shikimate dehydrogenase
MNMEPFAIIGNPVTSSLSPRLFSAAYPQLPREMYLVIEAPDAEQGWKRIKELHIQGFNVTMPFKTDFLNMADKLAPAVRQVRATNLLTLEDGIWTAWNTDITGVVNSFRGSGIDPAGKNALIIGAGGAGRAAALGLEQAGATVFIANRTLRPRLYPLSDIPSLLRKCTLIVNTVPCEGIDAAVINLTCAHTILDASYTLAPLRKAAACAGARYLGGYHWLYNQAVEGFAILTGLEPDCRAMRKLLDL